MKILAICVSIVVVAAVVAAFVTVGSPSKQRTLRFDERRVSDLQNIEGQINFYWQTNGKLPQALSNLSGVTGTDPETKQNYEYRTTSDKNYELCATFGLDSTPSGDYPRAYPVYGNESWNHGPGRVCFDRVVNTTLYPKPL
jgi:hypothetical protein